MHLLLLSGTSQSGHNGSSRVERALATALCARGFAVTLMSRDPEPLTGTPFTHRIYRRPSTKPWKTWLLAGRVAEQIAALHAERRIDLLHAFDFFPVVLYAARFAHQSGVPLIATTHSMELLPSNRALHRPTLRALEAARKIVALSPAQAERIAALGRLRDRIAVIPNGVDPLGSPEPLPPELALPDRFALFAGRFEEAKGVFLLLSALEKLPPDRRPRLVLAGDGREQAAVALRAAALGATILPWLTHPALMSVLGRASALVLPSTSETAPLLPLEALQRGVPVIAHQLPAFIGFESAAELLPIGDLDAWSRALERIAQNAHRDPARIAAGTALTADLDWTRIAARYADLYQRCV